MGGGYSSMVECLPDFCKALGSIPRATKKKKKHQLPLLGSYLVCIYLPSLLVSQAFDLEAALF